MSQTEPCPDCGHGNPSGAAACEACGFPLHGVPAGAPAAEPAAAAPASVSPPAASEAPVFLPPRPRRRRPPRGSNEALSLWLVFGTLATLVVLFVGVKSNVDRARPPVEGASPVQQVNADSLRQVIEADSTNVHARVHLGDVLYDTGNWSEAIIHYRAAVRMDSSLVNALVDLGVCYYNLGDSPHAEQLFKLALNREPMQPIALFNLGIVHERRDDLKRAIDYYQRSLATQPAPELREAILQAINRAQEKAGGRPPQGG